ncbi:MAG: response regulator [Actinomycetota bacterium]|nr:response regulator [Actinomycetota bacterium]
MTGMGDDLAHELMAVFTLEARERVQSINEHLLTLEKALSVAEVDRLLAEILREAHSLKGAARAVNLAPAEAVAHRLESLLLSLQKGSVARERTVFDLIYEAVDAIGAIAAAGGADTSVDVPELSRRLDEAGVPSEPVSPPPAATGAVVYADRDESGAAPVVPPPVESVRVPTEKLDAMLASTGQLLAARSVAQRRRGELRELTDELDDWQRRWSAVRLPYRRLLESEADHRERGTDREAAAVLTFLEEGERRLRALVPRARSLRGAVEQDTRRMDALARDIHDDVRRTRMIPVQVVLQGLPRMVRDLANALEKRISLRIEGADTEVDRSVLEKLGAPLTHLLRNCVDHGIEDQETRRRAGKPAEGEIVVRVAQRGDAVQIEVEDDGGGVDVEGVVASALERGVLSEDEGRALGERQALSLIFRPGFSTSPIITDVSGRGVGLDVVRATVEQLHGTVDVENRPGRGATFVLVLPLTLATIHSVVVGAGGEVLAVPLTNVVRVVNLGRADVSSTEGRPISTIDGEALPIAHVADLLGLPRQAPTAGAAHPTVVVASGDRKMGLVVDRLAGTQDVVLHALPDRFGRVAGIAAASILGSGELVMVLNVSDLIGGPTLSESARPIALPRDTEQAPASILVADDSITTRTLERNILRSAGYEVVVAADGAEAWKLLQQGGCDLVVSDVDMPKMGGFELTQRIRADVRLRDLPVVLVTSLDDPADRERGVQAGADAYIVKGSFDQDRLLSTIRRLL